MKSATSRTINGVAMNWVAFAVSAITAFYLSPFVVHHLGTTTYGVWILVTSTTSYLGLLDLGLRGAVIRYIAAHHAREEYQECNHALSVALWFRIGTSALVLAASAVLALKIGSLFRIPADMIRAASLGIILTGVSLVVTLTGGVFGGVLAALERFDLISAAGIAQTAANTLATVWLLRRGYGIVALAVLQLTLAVVFNVALRILSHLIAPKIRVHFGRPDIGMLRRMTTYSAYMSVLALTGQIIYYTDNVVVGAFLSAQAVGLYAIGGRLIEYLRQPVAALAQTFMPLASSLDARSERDSLRNLLIYGTKISVLVFWPLGLLLLVRGPSFIGLWMGPEYQQSSGAVLRILLIATMAQSANHGCANIVYGLGQHKRVAIWQLGEAGVNLILSIILVRKIGMYGVAWGTVIPELVINLLLWPTFITRLLDVPVRHFLLTAWLRPLLATIPFGAACVLADRYWTAHSTLMFFAQAAALYPIFLVTAGLMFRSDVRVAYQRIRAARQPLKHEPALAG